MNRLAALLLLVLLPLSASAKPDCIGSCENDRKNCEVACGKKVGKNAAVCKSSCAELTDPCRDACKKSEKRK